MKIIGENVKISHRAIIKTYKKKGQGRYDSLPNPPLLNTHRIFIRYMLNFNDIFKTFAIVEIDNNTKIIIFIGANSSSDDIKKS